MSRSDQKTTKPDSPASSHAESSSLPKMRVLSLFDGIGTGYYALSQLNFDIEVYYASEIDKNALMVSAHRFGDNIKQLGCVKTINEETIQKIGPIDLLIGGPPCNDLSLVNANRKEFYDIQGTALLLFEFYRIKTILDKTQRPYFWSFENVCHMENKNKNEISKFLGCEPVVVDSGILTPQMRRRFFWTNLPIFEDNSVNGEGPDLLSYLDENLGRRALYPRILTLTTKRTCLNDGSTRNPVDQNGVETGLNITEIEKLFGFPAHFTDVGNMNITQRHELLGRAWCVQSIISLFTPLKSIFASKQS